MTRSPAAAELAEEVAAAHGVERWRQAQAVEVRLSSGGLAFASKGGGRVLGEVTARLATRSQAASLAGSRPAPWQFRVDGSDELSAALSRVGLVRWSVDDVAAFAAAALWTYFTLPFVLLDPGYELAVLPRGRDGCRQLGVRFPAGVATHSPYQVAHIDGAGLIRRHDYAALAFGRWATAAHMLSSYRDFDGLLVPTRRRVTPRLGGRRLPGPRLVWIDVVDVRVLAEYRP